MDSKFINDIKDFVIKDKMASMSSRTIFLDLYSGDKIGQSSIDYSYAQVNDNILFLNIIYLIRKRIIVSPEQIILVVSCL
jgi:hypothetical protein